MVDFEFVDEEDLSSVTAIPMVQIGDNWYQVSHFNNGGVTVCDDEGELVWFSNDEIEAYEENIG